ncbi:ubiquitin carboxyl-terminal hydrolase 28 isoform X2 [Hemicordylus capensis]|uniref:ubiquitin carboxyl-terminal hydrolase 28 isoform X2 n=1 Tax=Hemicordylus capensis TaxID=884348 RepID=UPI0023025DBE|nr:ubiquitin carboxyl-terminal hydrolase 28 isoform X2 [Hemicordylus capensis]
MTAELQQAAPEGGAAERQARNCNVLINQLREITGIQDPLFLHETLKAVDGDLVQAVGFLTEGHATELGQEVTAAEPSDCQGCAAGQRQATSPVDATPSDEADLQKAVSLKVQDLPDVEAMEEDPDATAKVAHEASMAESKSRSKRKRCEVWGENAVQNEWRRGGEWPVGMKNVGNTCWFSAVIQSLFQLPEFRQLVLNYSVPNSVLENCQSHSKKRSITFMQELQLLFALMLGTCRKSVDPSTAVELLRGAFRPSEEQQQQDVSEITHKLLDWMEDAFQLTVNVNSSQDKSENPMVQLFYGTFLTEGIHEGNTFSIIETFGQYPLQVNGYKNLHECLEGAMVEGETELLPSNQPVNYGQERWFTKLPPVLTFELSRFEFNQSLGQPEKIHNKLEFPQIIYMDRFLYSNKELIQAKREELKKLKDQETVLQQKLERYMKYGSGTGHFPLPDMLQYVLEFASTKPSTAPPCSQASEPTDPQAEGRTSDVPPTESRVVVMQTTEHAGDAASAPASSHQELVSKPRQSSSFPVEMLEYPAPHVITQDEMSLVMTCLQRWRDEVEQDIKGLWPAELKSSIALLGQSVEQMYSDPQLHQVPYHLHAVLVHEGQANAGHYWAYIYNQPRKSWLKYNDLSVTESSWEELERDSFGGLRNASAYCLMYRNERLPHLAAVGGDAAADDEQAQREVESLTWELQKYIRDDNHRFEQEVADKEEEEQSCKVAQVEQSLASAEEAPCSPDSGQDQSPPSDPEARSLSSEHAMITRDQTAQAIAKTADVYEKSGAEVAFKKSKEAEPAKALLEESSLPALAEEQQNAAGTEASALPSSQISEVEIPSVGKILVRSDADGYNEEVMLSPAMQGVILAIAKARQTFDRDGSEAGLVKAFREEYSRLHLLSRESPTPQNDPRLQHVLIYFLQNNAPQQVVERTLLEQFADKNLSFDGRSISIMQVAQAKLKEIRPDEMDMEEYQRWHEDYSLFRKVSVYLLTGLELYQNEKYCEALTYLVHAYQSNMFLLMEGPNRGVDESLVALYRRKCLLKLNDAAAVRFESGDELNVAEVVNCMNEIIIPCMHLILNNNISQDDLDAIEVLRRHWCNYVGKEDMNEDLHLKLHEFLPRLLDCGGSSSAEEVVLKEPPKIRPNSPYDLCSRFAAVMESIHGASAVTVK